MTRLRMKNCGDELNPRNKYKQPAVLAALTGSRVAIMKFGAFPWKLFVQLSLVFLVNFINASNLDFYQDVEPEIPEDITYKQVARYLESQNHEQRAERAGLQHSRILPNFPWPYAEYRTYDREKEKILESLLETPAIFDVLQNEKIKNREEVEEWRRRAYDIREAVAALPARSYMSGNPMSTRLGIYNNMKILPDFSKNYFSDKKANYPDNSVNPLASIFPESENDPAENLEAENLLKLQGKFIDLDSNRVKNEETKSLEINESEPEFTFKFDSPKSNERSTFAIRPNDPRYYEDEAKNHETSVDMSLETTSRRSKVFESIEDENLDPFAEIVEAQPKFDKFDSADDQNIFRDKFSLMKVIMPDRRAERDPVLVTATLVPNNIYFIAIVAGCSAAAMFALVLIALTLCRLHRGVKAAADIEYPAYGVTGPNKDISPSGDQRLAHSAQMYHFQHQKQQIIAMENRTAASRDPGSVSEAESDEENEEGDYTVYECPGLASTGEMEVKNPMFLDDPTPATPPQIHKEEDHM